MVKEDTQEVDKEVEITTETESLPVETNTDTAEVSQEETQEPAEASFEPEEKSQAVPYDRFSEVNSEKRRLQEENARLQDQLAQTQYQASELEPEAALAVRREAEAVAEARESAKFEAKHSNELKKDPLLRAALNVEIEREIQNQRQSGFKAYIDREDMLSRAKQTLEARLGQVQSQAKKEGVVEGQDIAKTKQQLGAVGETGAQPKTDPDNLSAEEFAKYHQIPRSQY